MSIHPSPSSGTSWVITPICPAEIHADFDRSGAVNSSQSERQNRIIRPGAILIPNLNINGSLPTSASSAGLPDLRSRRDALDTIINGSSDRTELTEFNLCSPASCPFGCDSIRVRVTSNDSNRIRIFDISSAAPGSEPVVLGNGSTGAAPNEHDLSISPSSSWLYSFAIEATTLPGDPRASYSGPPPTLVIPSPPDPGSPGFASSTSGVADPANTADRARPIYSRRAPGEVWVEIAHFLGGVEDPDLLEVGLFTIAPFILLSNLQPVETVYVNYHPASNGNHDFVYDLAEALSQAFGSNVALPSNSSTPFDPSRPPNYTGSGASRPNTDHLYIIDGTTYNFDQWVQDQFEMGYCIAPHRRMHMVFHCKRGGGPLANFVRRELCGSEMALFDEISGPGDSLNFGGNLEVSPPVGSPTPAISRNAAGPAIPEQPESPFGKILVGDSSSSPIHRDFRNFLQAQKVQPYVPINTSWLEVAHIDEIISFVPTSSGKGFKLLIASVYVAHKLLRYARQISPSLRTNLFRGKEWDSRSIPDGAMGSVNAEISVDNLLSRAYTANERIRTTRLIPIEIRLKRVLDLDRSDIIRIPVYFDPKPPGNPTFAFTPGMVNMLVVNNHVMVAKPFGPRLRQQDAERILRDKLHISTVTPGRLGPLVGHFHWAKPSDLLANIATLYGVTEAAILAHPRNTGLTSGTIPNWRKIWIPEANVDLFEAYVYVVLEDVGIHVHFIDDWDTYHRMEGEVHCATNVKRTPPETASGYSGPYWWDFYEKML